MTQKELEASQFKLFSKKQFDREILFNQPPEPEPDISFYYGPSFVGCEITTVYPDRAAIGGSIKRTNESLFTLICNMVEEEIKRYYPKGFLITFCFNVNGNMEFTNRKKAVSEIGSELAKYISNLKQEQDPLARLEISITNQYLSDQILVRVSKVPDVETSISASYGGFPPRMDARRLYDQISEKQTKINDYKVQYDELWLLLISADAYSSDFDLIGDFDGSQFRWNKILLFSINSNILIQLQ